MIKEVRCYDCNRLIGKLDLDKGALRMLPGAEWTISGTCKECLQSYDTAKPTDNPISADSLMSLFGMKK
jgi:hypothetical protein